jgi:hypothetical protein
VRYLVEVEALADLFQCAFHSAGYARTPMRSKSYGSDEEYRNKLHAQRDKWCSFILTSVICGCLAACDDDLCCSILGLHSLLFLGDCEFISRLCWSVVLDHGCDIISCTGHRRMTLRSDKIETGNSLCFLYAAEKILSDQAF